ncbi:MAG: type II toxin-antitoxin system YafQ family toxin [Rhizobiaceae bacterium]|nr:type II toxin-antitoxin system YafQ family toxin [Rhizobiaceae bacterium]
MLTPVHSGQFRRDVKRVEKRGKDMGKLKQALRLVINGETLPERLKDHPLRGDWNGYRDLHLEPDWLLIYRIAGDELHLARTGSHSDLFDD